MHLIQHINADILYEVKLYEVMKYVSKLRKPTWTHSKVKEFKYQVITNSR